MDLDSQILSIWKTIYGEGYPLCIENSDEDLHTIFANKLNIPRQEAKELCHRIGFWGKEGVLHV